MNSEPLSILIFSHNVLHQGLAANMLRQLGHSITLITSTRADDLPLIEDTEDVDILICDLSADKMIGLHFIESAVKVRLIRAIILNTSLEKLTLEMAKSLVSKLEVKFLGHTDSLLQFSTLNNLIKTHLEHPKEKTRHKTPLNITDADSCSTIISNHIETTFQPILTIHSNKIYGVEVLSRWSHPSIGLISPLTFIPIFEKFEMLNQLFFTQLQRGLEVQKEYLNKGTVLNISFNLQPSQLLSISFADEVKSILSAHKLTGKNITLELTETGPLEISAVSIENLILLSTIGIKLSIDDFGIGHSSLRRFCQLPFNEIKIDREFVNMLGNDARGLAVIKSALTLSKAAEIAVIIEGVETQDQHQQLVNLGCLYGQGYLYGGPMTKQELSAWFDRNTFHQTV